MARPPRAFRPRSGTAPREQGVARSGATPCQRDLGDSTRGAGSSSRGRRGDERAVSGRGGTARPGCVSRDARAGRAFAVAHQLSGSLRWVRRRCRGVARGVRTARGHRVLRGSRRCDDARSLLPGAREPSAAGGGDTRSARRRRSCCRDDDVLSAAAWADCPHRSAHASACGSAGAGARSPSRCDDSARGFPHCSSGLAGGLARPGTTPLTLLSVTATSGSPRRTRLPRRRAPRGSPAAA